MIALLSHRIVKLLSIFAAEAEKTAISQIFGIKYAKNLTNGVGITYKNERKTVSA